MQKIFITSHNYILMTFIIINLLIIEAGAIVCLFLETESIKDSIKRKDLKKWKF